MGTPSARCNHAQRVGCKKKLVIIIFVIDDDATHATPFMQQQRNYYRLTERFTFYLSNDF